MPTRRAHVRAGQIRGRSRRSPRRAHARDAPPVATSAPTGPIYDVSAVVGAAALAQAIRDYGHLDIQLDPLGTPPHGAPELHPTFYGLTDAATATLPVESVPWPVDPDATNAEEAIDDLRRIYSGGIGYDFDQVQIAEERAWLREAVESGHYTPNLSPETQESAPQATDRG